MLIYLHGFNSSPNGKKGTSLKLAMQEKKQLNEYHSPFLIDEPQKIIDMLTKVVKSNHNITLVGSSLGGFYATYLAENYPIKSVLINPAIEPHKFMHNFIGTHYNEQLQENFEVKEEHAEQLENIFIPEINHPERFYVLLQKGDTVMPYEKAANKFKKAKLLIQEDGSHQFDNFEEIIPSILKFQHQ